MTGETILRIHEVSKSFGPVKALQDVSVEIREGEILAILGENGAGKSTLMKIISGLHQPDSGSIYVNPVWFGEGGTNAIQPRIIENPRDAMQLGIGMVYQHFQLVEPFTVAENIMLGNEITNGVLLDEETAVNKISELSQNYGLPIDAARVVEDLPVGLKQRVEILKQLYRNAKLLILDEPTAVLTPSEVTELFKTMRSLKKDGKSQIFISHKLHESLEIADRIVVIRKGVVVGEADPNKISKEALAEMVVGRKVTNQVNRKETPQDSVIFKVENLSMFEGERPLLETISFDVKSGEIVGIAGVEGNGQSELVEAIMGLKPCAEGGIVLVDDGTGLADISKMRTLDILKKGIGYIPEDRGQRGLILGFDLKENSWLGFHSWNERAAEYVGDAQPTNTFIMPQGLMQRLTTKIIDTLRIKTPSEREHARNLSGGNQQKVVLGREFAKKPRFIIASQPTRGVDIGVMEQVHEELIERRNNGVGVLLISADLDEILKLSDRVLVMYEGKILANKPLKDYDMNELSKLMLGDTGVKK